MWHQSVLFENILSNLNNFHSLEVVDRVSETQLQVGENSDWIIWRSEGQAQMYYVVPGRKSLATSQNYVVVDHTSWSKVTECFFYNVNFLVVLKIISTELC